MRVEHYLELADDLIADMAETKSVEGVTQIAQALQNYLNGPNEAELKNMSNARDELMGRLRTSRTNKYSATWKADLAFMQIEDYFGSELASWIERVFKENPITINDAKTEMDRIKDHIVRIETSLKSTAAALKYLEFQPENLRAGEFEFSVGIPPAAVRNELAALGEEFKRLDRVLAVFVEVATGRREHLTLNAISSSDFLAYIAMAPEVAEVVADALAKIIGIYGGVLGLIHMHRQLSQSPATKNTRDALQKDIRTKIDAELEEIAKEIEKRYLAKTEKARRGELGILIRDSLNELADRVDKGYSFDIRGEEPEAPEAEQTETAEKQKVREIFRVVSEHRQTIRVFHAIGDPVLALTTLRTNDKDNPSESDNAGDSAKTPG